MVNKIESMLEDGFTRILNKDVSAAVQICIRIARIKRDPHSLSFFLALQENAKGESQRAILRELGNIFDDTSIRKIYIAGRERALQLREIRDEVVKLFNPKNPEMSYLIFGSNLIDEEIEKIRIIIETSKPPPGMTPHDTAHFFDRSSTDSVFLAERVGALQQIKARMLTSCSNFLSEIERQVQTETGVSAVLLNVQDSIYAFLRENTNEGFNQFAMALKCASEGDSERLAASMTHLRRCLRTLADLVHPAIKDIEALNDDKYLNRLSKFIDDRKNCYGFVSPLDLVSLEKVLRNVNDRASKGVHGSVSFFEAQQVLMASILYIDNIRAAWEQTCKR